MNPISLARSLRRRLTAAEKQLWRLLRDRRFAGYKFRRQHPLGHYALDFYCAEAGVSVEIDGGQHGFPKQREADAAKANYLRSRGIVTKRFWNRQLFREPEVVKQNLWQLLQERAPHPENVPVTSEAKTRTWPPPALEAKVPLRANRKPPRVAE